MPIEERRRAKLPTPGPFLAEITNHLDPSYMGGIEVALIKGMPSMINDQGETYVVRYLSPFSGATSIRYEGTNSSDFNDVQKSYGWWAVPPDIGNIVMVIFIDGDPNQGYWIGCVSDTFQNHMIPGIAASRQTKITPEQKRKYGTDYLPVAEFHKSSQLMNNPNIDKIGKPVHPFAERLLAQGLLLDTIRGVTSSGARREVPSGVFGISTPGPLDTSPGAKKGKIGYQGNKQAPVSRLGGTTFVMDDGDVAGQNELVRIRTRTGHQILLHNSQDLIYIANSKGTAWLEMTSNGKIDIYAHDSISLHSEQDFNFRADRDINLEAGRNINIRANGSMNTNIREDYSLIVSQNGKLMFSGTYDHNVADSCKLSILTDFDLNVGGVIKQTAGGDFNIASGGSNKFSTSGSTNIASGGRHLESASEIHMNGPAATAASTAASATQPVKLPLFSLPNRKSSQGWANGNFYKASNINSIMQRVPTHEPWDQHENINPTKFSPETTDQATSASAISTGGLVPSANQVVTPPNTSQPAKWAEDADFINKVKSVASSLGCNYVDLLACMAFETGRTFDPSLRNFIGATGLIQFISSTAKGLGTTTDFLAGLTRTQQMDWVLKYFKAGKVAKISSPSLEDLYMQILWPRAVGELDSYVLFTAGSKQYAQNNGLDIGNKGYITKADAAAKVRSQLAYVKTQLKI